MVTLAALVFGLVNRHGLWRPAAETTAAFLDLAELRCRRSLRLVRFSYAFLIVEVASLAPWLASLIARNPGRAFLDMNPVTVTVVWFVIVCAPIVAWLALYARRVRRALKDEATDL